MSAALLARPRGYPSGGSGGLGPTSGRATYPVYAPSGPGFAHDRVLPLNGSGRTIANAPLIQLGRHLQPPWFTFLEGSDHGRCQEQRRVGPDDDSHQERYAELLKGGGTHDEPADNQQGDHR